MLTDDGKFNLNFVNFFLARETTDRVDPGAIASGGVWPGDFFFFASKGARPQPGVVRSYTIWSGL